MDWQNCLLGDRRDLIDQVLDKWSLSILTVLYDRALRFNELRREIPDVTQKSLAQTLKRLERNGIVDRTVLDTRPLAVEYSITSLGRTLERPLWILAEWAGEHIDAVHAARSREDASPRILTSRR